MQKYEVMRGYYIRNREKRLKYQHDYYRKNIDKIREYNQNYYRNKLNNVNNKRMYNNSLTSTPKIDENTEVNLTVNFD